MRKRFSAPSPRAPRVRASVMAVPTGQSILALEKRIAFDGAAVATTARGMKHTADVARHSGLPHEASHDTTNARFDTTHGDMNATVLGNSLSRETLRAQAPAQSKSVVFIESDVPDVKTLIKDIDPSVQIVMLDASKDGVDAIASYLEAHQGIQNVYIFSHGSDAHLSLGTADLDSASMKGRYAADLATIKSSLGADANILVYGCDFAQYADGDSAAHLLSSLTGAAVAASTNLTGGTALGGDFLLEDQIGAITAPQILNLRLADDYDGVLATQNTGAFTITTGTSGTATSSATVATATTADGAVKIVVTVTPNAANSANSITTKTASATFDTTAPTSAYTTSLNGAAALEETLLFGGSGSSATDGANSATISIAYFDAKTGAAINVTNPIVNIDRLGADGANASNQTVTDSSDLTLTSSGTLTKLAGSSNALNVTASDIYQTVNTVVPTGYSVDANADPTKGTSAGTVQVNGTVSTLTFNWQRAPGSINGGGDRIDLVFSADTSIATSSTALSNQAYKDGQSGISFATSQGFTEPTGLGITYTATDLPTGLTINSATGVISGTIDHDASKNGDAPTTGSGATLDGTYHVAVTATNSAGNAATQNFTIDSTNQAPVVGTATANQSNSDGDTITAVDASRAFSDPNGDPLTYTASNLPAGLSIDSSSGMITGTVAKNATPGTYSVTVTATDDKSAAASETFNWVVKDVPPTTSGTLSNQTYSDGQSGITIATSQGFTDSNGNTLTYSASGLPKGLTIDSASGNITGTIDHDASTNAPSQTGSGATLDGKYSVVVTASDGLGGSTTQSFTIDSKNTAPTLGTATATQNNSYGDTITPVDTSTSFSDTNGDPLAFTASGLPTGLSINSAGLITGTVSKTATIGIAPVTVTAMDDKGATTSETFNWGISGTPVTIFANSGTGLYHSNVEFLTYANTTLATNGITNGATATYLTAEGGTVTVTFSNVSNATDEATFKPAAFSTYTQSKFYTGYNNTGSTSEILYGSYNGTSSFTVSFSAKDKNGNTYTPNVAFADGEVTDPTRESYSVTTNGGNFQNVETVGSTGYSLTGVGTQTIMLQNDGGGVPLLVTDAASSLNITVAIAGGKEGFALALIVPTLTLDADNSSGSTGANYVTTFTQKGAPVSIADTDTIATEPGVSNASSATIVLTNAQAGDLLGVGTLPSGISGMVDTSVPGQITVNLSGTASRASYQSAIQAITFANTSNNPSSVDRTIDVTYNDGQLDSNTAVSTIHVAAVNNAPVETVPGAQTTNKDTSLAISGLSVSDSDANGGTETVTLSTTNGSISLASVAGLTFSTGTGSNDTTETFSGTLSAINQAISTVTYQPKTGYSGSDSLTFSTDDNGNTGSGGAKTTTQSVAITVANVNPTPNGTIANAHYADGQGNISIATSQAFSDSLGLTLSYSATGLPKGLTIDPTSGRITGTVDHDASTNAPKQTGSGATLDGTYSVVETASDGQGGSTTQTFTIDSTNQAPVVGTKTVNQSNNDGHIITAVDASKAFGDPNGDPLTYTASNLPPGLSISGAGLITGTVAKNATPGTYSVVVTATDDKGAAATETFNWVIKDVPPTSSGTLPNKSYTDGQAGISFATSQGFADSNGNPLTYSAAGLPQGLTINSATGQITGTIDHDASKTAPMKTGAGATLDGKYSVVVTANDGLGGTTTQSFTIDSTNQAPVVGTKTTAQTNNDGDTITAVDASKAFGDPNGDPLTYTASNLPPGLSISNAGLITGTVAKNAAPGTYAVVVTGTDDKGAATTEKFNWVVKDVPPTTAGTLANQAYKDGQAGIAIATSQGFSDSNGNPLTYSASGLPKGLAINAVTGQITGTIDHDASKNATNQTGSGATLDGKYNVVVTANDGLGGTTTQTFTIDATNQAPTLGTKTGDQNNADGDKITAVDASKAFSDPNGDPLTYTASNLPAGLSISTAGLITGTVVSNATPGTYPVSVTATDDKGATTSETFNWIIANKPPAPTGTLANQAYTDGQAGVTMATAQAFSDPNGNALTYSATGLPKGLTINATTGTITGTVDHDASKNAPTTTGSGATLDGRYVVVVTTNDSLGGSAKQAFTIDATNQAPSVGTKTVDQSNFDGDTIATVDASKAFSDPNGDPLTYTASNLPAGLAISGAGLITGPVAKNATPGTYAVVVSATDDKSAVTTETFNWIIKDVPPTTAASLGAQAYADGQSGIAIATSPGFTDSLGNPLTYSAMGLPKGLTIDPVTGRITGTIDHDASKNAPTVTGAGATLDGTYAIVVTASDGLGGTATQSFTIDASNQAPITGTSTANQSSNDGQAITLVDTSLAFSDPNTGDVLTYTISNLPAGLTLDAATGKISGTIAGNAAPGSYTVRVIATDDKGASAREAFTWTVADVPPTVSSQLPNQTYADSTPGISLDTTRGFMSPNGLPLVYTAAGLPAGLSIDSATGLITGALDHDASRNAPVVRGSGSTLDGTYNVTVTVSDGQGGTAAQVFTIDATNTAPALAHQTPDQHSADGNTASVDAAAAFLDKNTGDALAYSVTGLPPGLSIDTATGLISGSIASNASKTSPYSVTVSVTDDKGAVSSETFAWTVENVVPVATPPLADRAAYDGNGVSYTTADGFTNPNGLPLIYTATGLPKGVTIDATTGVISGTLDHDASVLISGGAYTIAVTVDDGQGGMATNTFHLAVTNQAPKLATPTPNQIGTDGQPIATLDASLAFSDPNGDPLTFTASSLPTGLSIDSTGKITGTIAATVKPGTYTSTVTATDDKGLVTSETFAWAISDVAPVTSSALPAGTYADSAAGISIATASGFVSPNGLVLTYSASGMPAGLAIDPRTGIITGQLYHDASKDAPVTKGAGATLDGTYTIVVTASDGQGGTAAQSFTLDAMNTAPMLGANTPAQSGPDGATVSVDAAAAFVDPNIGDVVTYTAAGLPPGLAIDPSSGLITGTLAATASRTGPYTVTVTATDDKGAATTEQFSWQVTDVAPVATGALSDQAAHDGAIVSFFTANGFADPNGPALTYSATGLPAGLMIDPTTGVISGTLDRNASTVSGGLYAIIVTADDGQGGTASTAFHLTSTNQAPVVQVRTANQTNTDGQAITPISVAAAFNDPNGDPLSYKASNLPAGLSIDASGTIFGTVAANATPGVYAVTIVATDSKGVATPETFTWTIADAAPTTSAALGGQDFVDSQANVSIATAGGFTSPNGLALRYSATGLPAGLAIDANTGLITGTIDHDASKAAPVETGAGATLDGTYAVTVTVIDGQGGTAQQTFTIDSTNQAPTLVSMSLDQHGTAGNTAQVNTAIAFTDPNNGDVLTYTATNLPTGLTINSATGLITGTIDPGAGSATPYAVDVTATDDKGAAVTKTIAWTVDVPGMGPTPIPNISLYDGATPSPIDTASHFSNPNGATLAYVATGLPSGLTIDASTGVIKGTVSSDASKDGASPTGSGATLDSTYFVTVTAVDPTNTTTPTSQTFVIDVANQAPVVVQKTVDQTTSSGASIATVDASLAFTDPNGDALTYAAAGLPSGLTIDGASGKITGTTAVGSAGTYAVTVTATDDKGAGTSELFAWTVSDTAPVIASTLVDTTYADAASNISIDASKGFSSPNGLALTYTAAGLPAGLSIDPVSGLITGALDHDASKEALVTTGSGGTLDGTYAVTVTASDGHGGSVTQTFDIDAVNQAPAVGTQTANQHGADGAVASVDAASAFMDPNLGDVLAYSATGLPSGLTIDAATGLITGTIDKSASKSGPYSVTVTAIDDKGAATSETFTYTVGTVPPVVVPLGDLSAYDASTLSIPTMNGFTNPNNRSLTYSATGLPNGLAIDPTTGLISGTLSRDASKIGSGGVYTIAVTADDGQGGIAVNTFHVVATNQTPVVVAQTGDQTSSDGQVITPLDASLAFRDPNGDPMTYSVSNLPKGLTINPTTGTITGTVSATAAAATGLVTVTATDDKGAAESETFLWTVNDTAPAKIGVIAAQSFADSTSGIAIATAGTFANPRGLTYAYSATGLPAGLSIDPKTGVITGQLGHDASAAAPVTRGTGAALDGTYTVVVSAFDGQGGTSTQVFTIDARNSAPVIAAQTANPLGYNGRTTSLDAGSAFRDPNTGDTLTFAATGLPNGVAIDPATGLITGTIDKMASAHGPYTVAVTATDDKGAATTETFVWTIDNIAPIATPPLADLAAYDSATLHLTTANGFTNPNALALVYTATGLPAGLAIDPTTGIISGTLDHDASALVANGRYTIAVTASDGLGGNAVNTFLLTATNQAPVVVAPTPDQVVKNGQAVTPIDASMVFKDPNGDPLTYAAYNLPSGLSIDPTSGRISGIVGGRVVPGAYEVTVLATDDKGAVSSETFHYVVDDNPPVKTGTLANQMYADSTGNVAIPTAGGFTSPNGDPLTFTASGLPLGLTIDPATGLISGFIAHDSSKNAPVTTGFGATLEGIYTVTITASDGLGGFATQAFMIEATNQAPSLGTPTASQAGLDRDIVSVDASRAFADPNIGDVLTYAATGLPRGLTINPANGLITGAIDPTASASGPYSVVVTATDDKGASTVETFTWTVADLSPTTTGTPVVASASDGQAVTPIDTASHIANSNGLPLTFSATGLPLGLTIDPKTGLITGTIDHDASKNAPVTMGSGATLDGTYTIVVTASDGQGGSATESFTLDSKNSAPLLGTATANQNNVDGDTIAVAAAKAFSDPNVGDGLTYAATGLPKGLAIDPASGLITGTIDRTASAFGPYTVVVTATDDKGAAASEAFTWTVANLAPTATSSPAAANGIDGATIAPIDTASHIANPNGLPLIYSASGLPAGLTIDPRTGLITGTIDHDASKNAPATTGSGATLDGTYTIIVTASDGQGGIATETFTLNSKNQAPVVGTPTANQTDTGGDSVAVDTSKAFSDPNVGDVQTYAATGLPKGLAIDPKSGLITGTIDPAASGAYTVVVTATDDKGAATSETFTWTVANLAPTATSSPAAASAADGAPIAPIDTASHLFNPSGQALVYAATGLPAGLTIDPVSGVISGTLDHDASRNAPLTSGSGATLDGTYTIVVTATDPQGVAATETFTLDATNQAPIVATPTADQANAAGDTVSVDTNAFDPNGDPLTYTAKGLPPGLTIDPTTGHIAGTIAPNADVGPYDVTVFATDDKGAVVTEHFVWTVGDIGPYAASAIPDVGASDGRPLDPIDTASHFADTAGVPLTYGATGLPRGLSIDPQTGFIAGTIGREASRHGPYTIIVTADDGRGGIATQTFTLDAHNDAPAVGTPTSDQTARPGQTPPPLDTGTAFYDPNGDSLSFSAKGLPPGLTIDPATGLVTGTVEVGATRGGYVVTVTATDDKGAMTSETFDWYVDNVSPNILGQPSFVPFVTPVVPVHDIIRDRPASADLHADGAVLDAVNAISGDQEQSLVIRADEIVVSTVNNVRPLNGLQDLNAAGAGIVRSGAAANERGDRYVRATSGFGLGPDLAGQTAPDEFLGSSLRDSSFLRSDAGATINIETLIHDRVLTIALDNLSDKACVVPVASYSVTRADGSPLPAWLHAQAKNVLVGKIPSGVEVIDLKIKATLVNGIVSERHVTIGTSSGAIRPVAAPSRQEGRLLSDMIAARTVPVGRGLGHLLD